MAVLENAYSISYERAFNELWSAAFTLPLNDPKNEDCKPLNYVEIVDDLNNEYIGLFRIIPKTTTKDESNQSINYKCEHVLATLLDSSLFKYHQIDGLPTKESLQYLIDRQKVKHWKLGRVDFTRYFSYKWENDNLLSALFSVPKPFDQEYQWTWDTTSYPWTLNLVAPEDIVTCEIREGKNLIGLQITEDPMGIYNRIYPLGYGEGDNQLTIESVNNGIPYVEDAESVAEFGIREYIWPDKRFEDAASLKASAEALLKKWRELKVSWNISAADLSSITGEDIDKFKHGRIVHLVVTSIGKIVDLRIMKDSKSDMKGNPGDISLEIGNKTDDLSTTQADIERRQQINELYAQGATNIDSHDYNDNADPDNPAEISFYLPDELVKINKLLLSFKTDKFRAYEKAIGGGGAVVSSTSSGGGTTSTSSSGGGVSTSTASGGGTTISSGTKDYSGTTLATDVPRGSITPPYELHTHLVILSDGQLNHSHSVAVPNHTHDFNVPNHTHTVTVPNHAHEITIPNHTHEIQFGIYKLDKTPTAVTIKVDGNTVPFTGTSGDNIDLIQYLSKDTEGKVNRGWHTVTIAPNDLGRINAQIYTQFFIQSRGGGSF
ncbi:phage tail spike protein [Neobacillus sp. WH10]|uniref:phage tail spike protein n=1 Tax=Neobacillus sp. WH10 TaxID=3047873 RepID=UPI0024C100CC|nr:phage tail spike protein [Neobacillus sp. WH10]WHY76220.1 phage tail spike protein [Neobacillus sp. WH10]